MENIQQSSDFVPNFSYGPCLYCNKKSDYKPEDFLECRDCRSPCHISCLRSKIPGKIFMGDNFFSFQCYNCNSEKKEVINRARMSTIDVLLLTLYNLHLLNPKDSKRGFFHYKKHVYRFIKEYCKEIYSCRRNPEECVVPPNIICGLLSKNDFFVCKQFSDRQNEVERGRWYALKSIASPAVLIHRRMSQMLKRNLASTDAQPSSSQSKIFKADDCIPHNSSVEDPLSKESLDESLGSVMFDFDRSLMSSVESIPSNIFKYVDEPALDIENTCEELLPPLTPIDHLSSSALEPPPSQLLISQAASTSESQKSKENVNRKKQKSHQEEAKEEYRYPPLKVKSYFTHSAPLKPPTPVKKTVLKEGEIIVPMTVYDERVKLNQLNKKLAKKGLSQEQYLLRRKLIVRQTKREFGLSVFNIDAEVAFMDKHERMMTNEERLAETYSNENAQWRGGPPSILDRYQVSGQALVDLMTKRNVTFRERLTGTGEDDFDFIDSPYTGSTLKPFIWRDYEGTSPKLRVLQEIVEYARKKNVDLPHSCSCRRPIDYRYVTPNHIPALNHLAKTYFWHGIDLSEILQYPDYTCVVSYGKLVIGFGVIVPDTRPNEGYISFLFVHPEWRKSGIGRFVLYHLIQSCQGRDITLHVSATNPAMILYQRFGFKVEEFLPNFYEKYLPYEDPQCKHAMFLRLHR